MRSGKRQREKQLTCLSFFLAPWLTVWLSFSSSVQQPARFHRSRLDLISRIFGFAFLNTSKYSNGIIRFVDYLIQADMLSHMSQQTFACVHALAQSRWRRQKKIGGEFQWFYSNRHSQTLFMMGCRSLSADRRENFSRSSSYHSVWNGRNAWAFHYFECEKNK